MRTFFTIIGLFVALGVSAQGGKKELAFKAGEQLSYVVSYKVGFIHTNLAEVIFAVSNAAHKGVSALHINAVGRVMPSYRWFFDMTDVYDVWVDSETGRPLFFKNNLKEGSYRFRSSFDYDWAKREVHTVARNLKKPQDRFKTMSLTDQSFDGLSLFFNLRAMDMTHLQPGWSSTIQLVLDDTIKHLRYKLLSREIRKVRNFGRFRTLKFSCQLTTGDAASFPDGSEFFLWLSDDRNKIPLYLESPIRVGTVKATITGWSNLKYPLDCLLK